MARRPYQQHRTAEPGFDAGRYLHAPIPCILTGRVQASPYMHGSAAPPWTCVSVYRRVVGMSICSHRPSGHWNNVILDTSPCRLLPSPRRRPSNKDVGIGRSGGEHEARQTRSQSRWAARPKHGLQDLPRRSTRETSPGSVPALHLQRSLS